MPTSPTGVAKRIVIVEDDPLVAAYLVSKIESADGLEIAFAASTLRDARAAAAGERGVDLYLIDLGLPDGNGLDLVNEIKSAGKSKVLIATAHGDRCTVLAALRAGADGYILKSSCDGGIVDHVRETLEGFAPISAQVATYLLEALRPVSPGRLPDDSRRILTLRETQILTIFSRGLSYEETAAALGISANTVRDFVKKIYTKLSVHSRSEAVFEARSLGLFG